MAAPRYNLRPRTSTAAHLWGWIDLRPGTVEMRLPLKSEGRWRTVTCKTWWFCATYNPVLPHLKAHRLGLTCGTNNKSTGYAAGRPAKESRRSGNDALHRAFFFMLMLCFDKSGMITKYLVLPVYTTSKESHDLSKSRSVPRWARRVSAWA